jgi:hypothetical protein
MLQVLRVPDDPKSETKADSRRNKYTKIKMVEPYVTYVIGNVRVGPNRIAGSGRRRPRRHRRISPGISSSLFRSSLPRNALGRLRCDPLCGQFK